MFLRQSEPLHLPNSVNGSLSVCLSEIRFCGPERVVNLGRRRGSKQVSKQCFRFVFLFMSL
ncbi:unnamed protein product [Brassica napus]|uniref:(rape) hypothetical protein n=1 Tax=Brassica napus TaxID=3708 RepID=A0A816MFP7_BRANA|nr:unnamed protein product [Brassica napus]